MQPLCNPPSKSGASNPCASSFSEGSACNFQSPFHRGLYATPVQAPFLTGFRAIPAQPPSVIVGQSPFEFFEPLIRHSNTCLMNAYNFINKIRNKLF